MFRTVNVLAVAATCFGLATGAGRAEEALLREAIELPALALFYSVRVPGLVLGVVKDGETAVVGFGEIADGTGKEPDGDTMMRIGSITKVFTGTSLASLVADGTVGLADPVAKHLGWAEVPTRDGHAIRLIELATHTSGLPREVEREPGPADDPFATLTEEAYEKALAEDPLLFAPGTGGLYSNFAFDLLGIALGKAAGKPFADVQHERAIAPAGLEDTVFALRPGDEDRLMQGHGLEGEPLPNIPTQPVMAGASGLYSTPNDILKWLAWHMDRFAPEDAGTRVIDHAAYVFRDEIDPVLGLDESGHMDAMALGWIVMTAEGSRPLILQKAGGLQGMFVYAAFSPARGVGAFVAINEFNFAAASQMATVVNDIIADLAQR